MVWTGQENQLIFIYLLQDHITGSVRTDRSVSSFVGFILVVFSPAWIFSTKGKGTFLRISSITVCKNQNK